MPLTNQKIRIKTAAELKAEVGENEVRLEKDTKVIALEQGYCDTIREPGDIFYVKKGTIYEPGVTWFELVSESTATTEETDEIEGMTVPEIKIELSRLGVDFAGVTKKVDLVDMLVRARNETDLA